MSRAASLFYVRLHDKVKSYIVKEWTQTQVGDQCVQFAPLGIRNDHLGGDFFLVELSISNDGKYKVEYVQERRVVYLGAAVSLERIVKMIQGYITWRLMEYKIGGRP